jgi:hypothetical protein
MELPWNEIDPCISYDDLTIIARTHVVKKDVWFFDGLVTWIKGATGYREFSNG